MKIAISVPDPIFEAAERLAEQRCVPRSRIFTEALEAYLELQDSAAITDKLNRVYEQVDSSLNADLSKAQIDSVSHEAW